jgi:hypothetical protein
MKTTYILLRNNQETGPHSEETLKSMGLKPDDLIWVEGSSVYWQHPSDFKELQSFISAENNWEKYTPAPEKIQAVAPVPAFNEPELNEGPIYIPLKKKRSRTLTLIFRPASQNVALYAGLLVAGIAAGIVISKKAIKPVDSIANSSVNNAAPVPKIKAPAFAGTDTTVMQSAPLNTSADSTHTTISVQDPQPVKIPVQTNTEKNLAKANPQQEQKDTSAFSKENIQTLPEKTDPALPVKDDKPSRAEVSSLVSVKANDYIVAAFGGIRDLELTVKNSSKVPLEKVIVELTYLKPRDEFLRSENISFRDVPAEGKLTIPVKKSNRGVKVTCKVVKVEY